MTTRVPRVVRDFGFWTAPEENKVWRGALSVYNYTICPGESGFYYGQSLSGLDIPVRIDHHPARSVCHAPGAIPPSDHYGVYMNAFSGYPAFLMDAGSAEIDLTLIADHKMTSYTYALVFAPSYSDSGSAPGWEEIAYGGNWQAPLQYHRTGQQITWGSLSAGSINYGQINVVVCSCRAFGTYGYMTLIANGNHSSTDHHDNEYHYLLRSVNCLLRWRLLEYSVWFPAPDHGSYLDASDSDNFAKNIYRHYHRKYGLGGQLY